MNEIALHTMSRNVTLPYKRGAEFLEVPIGEDASGFTWIEDYDFKEYHARYSAMPEQPKYIIYPLIDVGPDPIDLEVFYRDSLGESSVSVHVPSSTYRHTSFYLPLDNEFHDVRLIKFEEKLIATSDTGRDRWKIMALLGNIAKLFWVLGLEKDCIFNYMREVKGQRILDVKQDLITSPTITQSEKIIASHYSLDLIGKDLQVPRFPPIAYSFDEHTLALYHLDDIPEQGFTEILTVKDQREKFDTVYHEGENNNAQSYKIGKFNRAFKFDRTPGGAFIEIPDHTDFALPPDQDATIEAFIKPKGVEAGNVQIILNKEASVESPSESGWSFALGNFWDIENNLRWSISDGTDQIDLFADIDLVDDRFHHIAGIIDRATNRIMLFIDGKKVDEHDISSFGAITNTQTIRLGTSHEDPEGNQFLGVIDEVRFSNIARMSFHPVLGESDQQYRQRLNIFKEWRLPTRKDLQETINRLVKINGEDESFVLSEKDSNQVSASKFISIFPETLPAGVCISSSGDRRVNEFDITGSPEQELDFDPIFLIEHNDTRVDYGTDPNHHKMQIVTARCLDRLLDLIDEHLQPPPSPPGNLVITESFNEDTEEIGLHGVGRALQFEHPDVDLDELAALAHRAGFDFVCNMISPAAIYASVKQGEKIEIVNIGTFDSSPPQSELFVGDQIALDVKPDTFSAEEGNWITIKCGNGDGIFKAYGSPPCFAFEATAPGKITLKVEYRYKRKIVFGTLPLTIWPRQLDAGEHITSEGNMTATELIGSGALDDCFHEIYLEIHNDSRVNYRSEINHQRMQLSVSKALNKLLDLIEESGSVGQLNILEAYNTSGDNLHRIGRALNFTHDSLSLEDLGVLAHRAGFGYVEHVVTGSPALSYIHASMRESEKIEIIGPDETYFDDETTGNITLEVPRRTQPSSVSVSPDGSKVYITNYSGHSLTVLNAETNIVEEQISLLVGLNPTDIAITPDGTKAYVVNSGSNNVSVIDLSPGSPPEGHQHLKFIDVGPSPHAIVITPDGNKAYVTNTNDNTVSVIDLTTDEITGTPIDVGTEPYGIDISPDGSEVLVTNRASNDISFIRTTDDTVDYTIADIDSNPLGIAITPDGTKAYVSNGESNVVTVIDVAGRTIGPTIPIGIYTSPAEINPDAVAINPDGSQVYVAERQENQISVIDTETNSVIKTLKVRENPSGIGVRATADGQTVYVTNYDNDDLSVIQVTPITSPPSEREIDVINTIPLGIGLGELITWSFDKVEFGDGHFNTTTQPRVIFTPTEAGLVLVRAVYSLRDNTFPYTFEIRLREDLDRPDVIIPKHQYDIIMNILNYFHPIGVEVITRNIRKHVVEVRENLLEAFPDYTYPNYRI